MKVDLRKGDCLEVMKNIASKSVDMILCDLPYGKTKCKWDVIIPFEPLWEQYNRIIKDNGAIVLFGSEPFSSLLRMSNNKMFKYDWYWNKGRGTDFLNARRKPLSCVETISVFYKKLPTYNPQYWYGKPYDRGVVKHSNNTMECYGKTNDVVSKSDDGKRYPLNLININKLSGHKKNIHPTQKPVDLLQYLIKTYTNEGETVLDNCMGSGSTGVACINTNRNFIGIELGKNESGYFEVAENRIKQYILDNNLQDIELHIS